MRECDLDLRHFDVHLAFVRSDLEDVFLRLYEGCDLSCKIVCLNRSLYGLNVTPNNMSSESRIRAFD